MLPEETFVMLLMSRGYYDYGGMRSEHTGLVRKVSERKHMATDITIATRELTPFEQLVLGLVCEGKSNAAIARETSHTEKVIENTVSRSARVFAIKSDGETNVRVLLALAFRAHYGDGAFDQLGVPCSHFELDSNGVALCNRHTD
jgi:DNA-binding NarL/FixJ family response regulator